jgi:autotransporter-associated beta strand protein
MAARENSGPGTLVLVGDGSGASINWDVRAGRVEVGGTGFGSMSRVEVFDESTVRLIDDTTLGSITNFSPIEYNARLELNGHTLTLARGSTILPAISGPGTLVIPAGQTAEFDVIPDSIDSGYALHAEGTVEINDISTYFDTPFAAIVIGADGLVTGNNLRPDVGTGRLAGTGRLDTRYLRFGGDDSSGTFAGVLENTELCVKQGTGSYTLSGDNNITGEVVVEGGELAFSSPQSVGTPTEIEIQPGAQLNLMAGSSVNRIIGGGTLNIIGSSVTLGENGSNSNLGGALLGFFNSNLRKRGGGTLTISGDTSGFQGFFDVQGGTCVFEGVSLVPNGFVSVNGLGTLRGHGEIASSLLVQNLLTVSPGQTLRLTGVDKRNFGLFEAPATSVLTMDNVSVLQDGNGPFGTIRADGGTVRLGDHTEITDGTIEAVNGGTIELAGQAVLRDAMIVGSITRLAGGGLELDNSALTLASGDTLSVLLDQDDAGTTAVITGAGSADLAGTLHLEFADGFTPATGDRFPIIGGTTPNDISVSGTFDTATLPDLGANVLRLNETPTGIDAVVTCTADLAQPYGVLDLSDINSFVSGFVSSDLAVDLDGNGILDLSDIGLFIAVAVDGCP